MEIPCVAPARENCKTFLDYFEKNVAERGDDDYLGTRIELGMEETPEGKKFMKFGEYQWMTYKDVANVTEPLARGMHGLKLATETEGDNRKWKFVGIWAKNRWEWLATHIANMYFNHTTIGFFDSMGAQSVDFILNQTELSTIFVAKEYVAKLVSMKRDGLAAQIQNLVSFDLFSAEDIKSCQDVGIKLHNFKDVVETGKSVT